MRQITAIHDGWLFTKNAPQQTPPTALPQDWEAVTLPHTWNNLDGQDGGSDYYRGPCWYCRALSIPVPADGGRIYLEFQGANSICEIYVNGQKAARHEGGFSTFRADITPYLKADGDNLLAVMTDNGSNDTVYPQMADFTFFGGLYRKVSLITVPESHFDLDYYGAPGLRVTPLLKDGAADIALEAYLTNARDGQTLLFEIYDSGDDCIARTQADIHQGTASIRLENPHLWNGVEDPYLYKACAKLLEGGTELDAVCARFGVRTFEVRPDTGFSLNGRPYPLHGVSRHQDRLDKGWAIGEKEHEEDMKLIQEVGANTIRLAHYQHDAYFYDLCDEAGMVVWAEIPFISMFLNTPEARENTLQQMRELVVQNYNHPSICFWGISNEISIGGESEELLSNLHALNDLVHELDQTRLTTMANLSMVENDSPLNHITDVISYNHYFGWYLGKVEDNAPWLDTFHADNPEICLGISEYGCEGITTLHSASPKVRDYSEEYQACYHEKMLETFAQRSYLWSTHVWNMFDFASDMRDEGGVQGRNNKGLVTFDRQTRKDSFYIYKAYWTKAPFVHICSRRFKERAEETVQVKVYSNCEQVSLKVNGKKTGSVAGKYVFTFDRVPLTMGENIIQAAGFLAQQEVCCESIPLVRVTEPNASYMLAEEAEKAGQNVENWFATSGGEGEEPLQFPEGYFSIKDKVGALLKNPEGEQFVSEMIGKVMPGMKVSKGMLNMAKHFTIEKVIEMAGDRITPEMVRYLNQRLNQIKK